MPLIQIINAMIYFQQYSCSQPTEISFFPRVCDILTEKGFIGKHDRKTLVEIEILEFKNVASTLIDIKPIGTNEKKEVKIYS